MSRAQRKVKVKPFYIDIFPVSNEQFRNFVRETKYKTETESSFGWSFAFQAFVADEVKEKV